MKRQIRRGTFETNSSSTHSIVMANKSDYDKWNNGEVLLYTGSWWRYPEDNKPLENHFYTKEEAIAFEKSSKYAPDKDFDWTDDENVMEMLHDNEWYDEDYYWNHYAECYETFEDELTTPSGDTVVAFGFYGHD